MKMIEQAVANLDYWLDTMRSKNGYFGPVSHWWRDNIYYCGEGFDWRYEGIITGYLNLYKNTGENKWLKKARVAAHDLVNAMLPNGAFKNSSFELNPYDDGTIHNAAADIGLLELSKILKEEDDARYKIFMSTASSNIEKYLLGTLWNKKINNFSNLTSQNEFSPNKTATIIEALLLYSELGNVDLDEYIVPASKGILNSQDSTGGIYQGSSSKYLFPFYSARCIPALKKLYAKTENTQYKTCSDNVLNFLQDMRDRPGFYQLKYPDKSLGKYPVWIAGLGDILRCSGISDRKEIDFIINNQDTIGGIRTSYGFNFKGRGSNYDGEYDFRDMLHVCGWNDKAFRFLTQFVDSVPGADVSQTELECIYKGADARFIENEKEVLVKDRKDHKIFYHWKKGERWAKVRT
jgi:hypothetical protein